MRLEGYRCDTCNVESADKPGDWYVVQLAKVTHGFTQFGWNASMRPESHYCSSDCVVESLKK